MDSKMILIMILSTVTIIDIAAYLRFRWENKQLTKTVTNLKAWISRVEDDCAEAMGYMYAHPCDCYRDENGDLIKKCADESD